jgi:hypothetical protein
VQRGIEQKVAKVTKGEAKDLVWSSGQETGSITGQEVLMEKALEPRRCTEENQVPSIVMMANRCGRPKAQCVGSAELSAARAFELGVSSAGVWALQFCSAAAFQARVSASFATGRVLLTGSFSLFTASWKVPARCSAASYSGRRCMAAHRSSTLPWARQSA